MSALTGSLTDRDSWSEHRCSAARALEVIGTPSNLFVLREAFYGTTYFNDFVRHTPLSAPATAKRLRELVEVGLLRRIPYQAPGQRTRDRYELTEPGQELLIAYFALMEWGDRHATPGTEDGPVRLRHRSCGAPVHVELSCSHGHTLAPSGLEIVPAPALSRDGATE
ncbi:winged helix-turn-helix transcriptional regulator [Streptomyces kaempferi]|uniref:Winged helix-turn-helix transcriptional regulator n=1 Tax=Streptomyces kaempferi TaxID=333725 RepID=A0ABW3XUS2_9ACTN